MNLALWAGTSPTDQQANTWYRVGTFGLAWAHRLSDILVPCDRPFPADLLICLGVWANPNVDAFFGVFSKNL